MPVKDNDMAKEIKDYLHLYLGCEVVREDAPEERITMTALVLNDLLKPHGIWKGKYKPILRPLSDMTDEEKHEVDFIRSENPDIVLIPERGSYQEYILQVFRYLLSKHFDLFGLIEAGLAIDKTKLKANG